MPKTKDNPGFTSEYFKSAEDLKEAKDDAYAPVKTRRERLLIVRKFVNMIPTLTEEEKEELNRTEATNFGTIYRDMQQNETMFTSMMNGTNALVEIIVDTDNIEKDTELGARLTEAINRGAIHHKGKFANFWKKCAGEITVAGGGPVVQKPRYGWLPELRTDMFFPKETDLDSDMVTYAFDPKELTMGDLKKFLAAVKDDEKGLYQKKNLEALIETLKEQIETRNKSTTGRNLDMERSRAVRDEDFFDETVTLSAWWYYEVKFEDNGETYVSATLFTDGIEAQEMPRRKGEKDNSAKVIAYWDKAYESASDWLQLVAVDSEIGGVKNLDTLRGVAEMVYPSAIEMEELFNLLLEGDKMRAKPKWKLGQNAAPDKILKWNAMLDPWVPDGVEELEHRNTGQNLLTPIGFLRQNAAGMAAAPVQNTGRGGELRVQNLERQESNSTIIAGKMAEGYTHLDAILETIVWRILAGPVKPGTEGYQDIMWIRARLDKYGIDYKKLATRKHGRFEFLRVRAHRVTGNGNREQQMDSSDWLMANLVNFPPQVRPLILKQAVTLRTGDPDLAEAVSHVPKAILNSQKVTAENERDTIRARVSLGISLPVMPDDIHQDHIPVHILDMAALVAMDSLQPWTKREVLEFAGLSEHTAEHLTILLSNPATNPEAKVFLRDFQNAVSAAQAIVTRVEEAEGSEQAKLDPKEQADMELKWAQLQTEWVKIGIKTEDMKQLWENRDARARLSQRQQYAREVDGAQRLELDKQRVEIQAKTQSESQSKAPPKK